MANKGKEKKVCQTVIPREWEALTGPTYSPTMTVSEANAAWRGYLRKLNKVGRNPKVYK